MIKKLLKFLVEKGADLDLTHELEIKFGTTLLKRFNPDLYNDVTNHYISKKKQISEKFPIVGNTALHYTEDQETAKILIEAGANVNIPNEIGGTILKIAKENNWNEAISILTKMNALDCFD